MTAERTIRTYAETIGLLSRGRFAEKVDEHLTHAVEHLAGLPADEGKATVTVTLSIHYQSGRIEIVPSVKSKLPEEKGFAGTPFWTVDGGLSVQHPSQIDMFPRDAGERERSRAEA